MSKIFDKKERLGSTGASEFVAFSLSLQAIVDQHVASGLIAQAGNGDSLRLVGDGLRVAKDVWTAATPTERLCASSAKEFFNDMTYDELNAYACAELPDAKVGVDFSRTRVDAAASLLQSAKVSVSRAVTISGLSEDEFFGELKARDIYAYSIDKAQFEESLAWMASVQEKNAG